MIGLLWAILGATLLALLAVFVVAELKARGLGIDRSRIEGRYAGYDPADLANLFTGWGLEKVAAYRDDLLLRDRVFAAGLLMWVPFFGLALAMAGGWRWLGPLSAGLLVLACLFDLKESSALRQLMTVWPASLSPGDVALAARSTRLKRLFYTLGLMVAAFALLALMVGHGVAALAVSLVGLVRLTVWFIR